MSIQVGDTVPDVSAFVMSEEGPEAISTSTFCSGKKIVLFAVPGAFTPTCSEAHLPGFIARRDELLSHDVDEIACISVNDVFVMHAWGKQYDANGITMIADGLAEFAKAVGMTVDYSARGLGIRSDRYAMIIENAKVTWLAREEPRQLDVSTAEAVLKALR